MCVSRQDQGLEKKRGEEKEREKRAEGGKELLTSFQRRS